MDWEKLLHRRWPLLALMAPAIFPRLYHIDAGLWYDEIYSLQVYFVKSPFTIATSLDNPNNHILYSLLAHVLIGLFGESEPVLRLPAVMFGIAGVGVLWWLAKSLTGEGDKRFVPSGTAFISSLLLSVSLWHVWFSQDARGYSGMITLTLLSSGLFWQLCGNGRRLAAPGKYGRTIFAYVISISAACYFHLFGVFTLGAHLALWLAVDRLRFRRELRGTMLAVLVAAGVIFLLYAPVLGDMAEYLRTQARITAGRELTARYVLLMPFEWAGWGERPIIALPIVIFWLMGVAISVKKRPFMAGLGLLPPLLALLFTWAAGVFTYYRMFGFCLPWYFLFTAIGLEWTSAKLGKFSVPALFAGALAMTFLVAYPLMGYYKLGKQGYKKAAEWTRSLSPDVPVYSFGLSDYEFWHYNKDVDVILYRHSIREALDGGGIFISSYPWSWGPENTDLLRRHCRLLKEWPAVAYKENAVYAFYCPPGDTEGGLKGSWEP